jgi:DNA-binding transcriptional ArsR family regulator
MSEPFRARLLQAVSEKSQDGVSVRQLAARLAEPKRKVRYHLDALSELGLVEVLKVEKRRGVIERFYRATVSPLIPEELGDRDQARQIQIQALKAVLHDASGAIGAKLFGLRPGHAVIRVSAEVDPEGWSELVAIQERALSDVEAAVARSRRRLDASTEPRIAAVAAMLLFEVSPWPPG